MGFYKQVTVLKYTDSEINFSSKIPSGIVRIEGENDIFTLHLSLINIPYIKAEYFALIYDSKKKIFVFPLGERPTSVAKVFKDNPDLKKGFCSGVYFVKNNLPETILFARTENFNLNLSGFKKVVADNCLYDIKNTIERQKKQEEIRHEIMVEQNQSDDENKNDYSYHQGEYSSSDSFISPNKNYDDEAVATTDYYINDKNFTNKFYNAKGKEYENHSHENESAFSESKEEKEEIPNNTYRHENETDNRESQKFTPSTPYYMTVKTELDKIFSSFPREKILERIIPQSKWAKINYNNNNYYVVGLVSENHINKYICYGVPAPYSKEPPKELMGFCSFVPLSVFNLKGDGYWMMFQDADNGKCVHLS